MAGNEPGLWAKALEPFQPLEHPIQVGPLRIGDGSQALIAGPCAIDSEALCLSVAEHLASLCSELGIPSILKSSYDKANHPSAGHSLAPGPSWEGQGGEPYQAVRQTLTGPQPARV